MKDKGKTWEKATFAGGGCWCVESDFALPVSPEEVTP